MVCTKIVLCENVQRENSRIIRGFSQSTALVHTITGNLIKIKLLYVYQYLPGSGTSSSILLSLFSCVDQLGSIKKISVKAAINQSPESSSGGEGGGVFSRSRSEPSLVVRFRFFFENCSNVLQRRKKMYQTSRYFVSFQRTTFV